MKKIWILMLLLCISFSFAAETRVLSGFRPNIYLYSQSPNPVEPGNYVDLRIKVENIGVEALDDFQIEFIPEYPFSLEPTEPALKKYGSIGSGNFGDNGIIAEWKVRVDKNAVEGDSEFRLRYKWGNDEWIYQTLEARVKTEDAILNIKNVYTVPEQINPGEKFELKIEVENLADSFLRNLKFELDTGTDLVPIGNSDVKYIKHLNGNEIRNVSFSLISTGSADATIYETPLKVTFEDNEGTSYTKNTSFGIILLETPQLIKNIEDTEVYVSGDRGEVSISISNIGIEEVKFVKATLMDTEDYRVISTREVYLGNIDSDDFENANYDIYVKTRKDSVPINFMLHFKDSLNKEHTENVTLALPLYSGREAKKLGLKPSNNFGITYLSFVVFIFGAIFWIYMLLDFIPRKMPRYKKISWYLIFFLTTIFGAILYYVLIKRRKNNHNA